MLPSLLPLLALPLVSALQHSLYHRLYHPALPNAPFSQRGIIDIGTVSLHPSTSVSQDLAHFAEVLTTLDASTALYQVALGDTTQVISSIKACHLQQAVSELIYIDSPPFAVDYFVYPTPRNGACPTSTSNPFLSFAKNIDTLNTTVLLREPRFPPLPTLQAPPPLTAEGAPVQTGPEKTFIQKYWMYIVALLIALFFASGEDEGPRRRAP